MLKGWGPQGLILISMSYFRFLAGPSALGALPPLSAIMSIAPLSATTSILTSGAISSSTLGLSSAFALGSLPTAPITTATSSPAGALSSSTTPALVLSPSLPPVPGKLVAKIRSGAFVQLKELLGDNIALRQRLDDSVTSTGGIAQPWWTHQSHPQMRSINSPLQWVYCMLLFIAVRCPDPNTRDMLTYARLILHMAQKHGGSGWLEYDHTFRAQAAANPATQWNTVNPSLLASAVLSASSSGSFCHHCQEVDHAPTECALVAFDPSLGPKPLNSPISAPRVPRPPPTASLKPHRTTRPSPYDLSVEVCRRFNRGACSDTNSCRYRHICSVPGCKRTSHGAWACPMRDSVPPPPPPPPHSKPAGAAGPSAPPTLA